jgi:hypothetical protein
MMKVKATFVLDLPESFAGLTDVQLRNAIQEEFLGMAHRAHKEQVLELADVMRQNGVSGDEPLVDQTKAHPYSTLAAAKEYSLMWMKVTDVPDWWIERCE